MLQPARDPGKGFLFQEPLAKVGSADRTQIYGEIGLEYGSEAAHGKITRLASQTTRLLLKECHTMASAAPATTAGAAPTTRS